MSEVYLEGSAEFNAALARLAELVADLRPFWPLVVPLFIGWMGRQFDSEGDYFGSHWQPLTQNYAAWKMQHYPDKGILSAEGDLRKAATSPTREPLPQSLVLRITPYEKTEHASGRRRGGGKRIGTGKMIDPSWFQEGTDRMVARPLLAELLPADAQAELTEAADFYIRENARKLGLLAD